MLFGEAGRFSSLFATHPPSARAHPRAGRALRGEARSSRWRAPGCNRSARVTARTPRPRVRFRAGLRRGRPPRADPGADASPPRQRCARCPWTRKAVSARVGQAADAATCTLPVTCSASCPMPCARRRTTPPVRWRWCWRWPWPTTPSARRATAAGGQRVRQRCRRGCGGPVAAAVDPAPDAAPAAVGAGVPAAQAPAASAPGDRCCRHARGHGARGPPRGPARVLSGQAAAADAGRCAGPVAAASCPARGGCARCRADYATLCAIVARHGHDDEADARRAWARAMHEALPNAQADYAVPG